MASLVELLALAKGQQSQNSRPYAPARVAEGFLMGIGQGIDARRQRESNSLETYSRMLDIQEKLQRAETERENAITTRNMAKSLGLLPYDEDEQMTARTLATDAMSRPPAEKTAPVNNVGKMGKFFDEFAPTVSMGKEGMRMSFRKRYPKPPTENTVRLREDLAKRIYNRDHPERQVKDLMDRPIPYNPTSFELKKSGAYQAADDLLKNYMPGFDSYVEDSGEDDFLLKDTEINLD